MEANGEQKHTKNKCVLIIVLGMYISKYKVFKS